MHKIKGIKIFKNKNSIGWMTKDEYIKYKWDNISRIIKKEKKIDIYYIQPGPYSRGWFSDQITVGKYMDFTSEELCDKAYYIFTRPDTDEEIYEIID